MTKVSTRTHPGGRLSEYRYRHFTASPLHEDRAFTGGVRPGESFPDFDLPTIDGGRATSAELVGRRPLFVSLASIT